MASSPLYVVVMAAGQGKRMHSALPKPLHPLAGRPLVSHVLDTARSLAPKALCLVIGHGAERVRDVLAAPDLAIVTQDPPRGTGDAVRVALEHLPEDGVTVVTNGDCPLIAAATLSALAGVAAGGHLAVLTARVSDPAGLGRVVRDGSGAVRAIVEDKDAGPAERAIDEIYTGALAAPTSLLRRFVAALRADNAQREFYLTDVVKLAVAEGAAVKAHVAVDESEALGVNDRAQLAAHRAHRAAAAGRGAPSLRAPGSPIPRASTCAARSTAAATSGSTSAACSRARVELADDVEIGADCVLRDVTVGAGTTDRIVLAPRSCRHRRRTAGSGRTRGCARRATLADDVHIGNFVEVKNASAGGRGTKANHLAYIGDATIGARVNIGAGTITATTTAPTSIARSSRTTCSSVRTACWSRRSTIGAGATIGAGHARSRRTLRRTC